MFKLCFVLVIATLSLVPHMSHAECCSSLQVFFRSRDKDCEEFTGARNAFYVHKVTITNQNSRRCTMHVCNDGEPITGSFCGRGPCNIFGCNCEGGCIEGNMINNFKALHGDSVYDVHF